MDALRRNRYAQIQKGYQPVANVVKRRQRRRKTAAAGSNTIEVLNAGDWKKGDVIVLASTGFRSPSGRAAKHCPIRGNMITLDKKLDYMHFGKITDGVDERAEVGMLSAYPDPGFA